MDDCFHRRGHEHSPYQYICFVCCYWESWVTCCSSQVLLQELKDLGHVLMVRVCHVLNLWFLTHPAQASLCNWSNFVFGVAPHANCFHEPLEHSLVDSLENVRLLILKWIVICFQGAIFTSFRSSAFPGLTRFPKLCEESFSLLRLRITRLMGLVFAGITGLDFAIGESSFEIASWPLFDMTLCFPTCLL